MFQIYSPVSIVSSDPYCDPGFLEIVSDVTVTDGVQTARAISFFSIAEGKVTRLVEFWPEPYTAPANRAHLVETME